MFTLYWKLYVFKVPYQYLQNLVRRDESAPVEWIVRCCWKFQVASTFNTHFELKAELIFSKYCFILFFDLKRKENKKKWRIGNEFELKYFTKSQQLLHLIMNCKSYIGPLSYVILSFSWYILKPSWKSMMKIFYENN